VNSAKNGIRRFVPGDSTLRRLGLHTGLRQISLGLLVGTCSGFGAIVFRWLISEMRQLSFSGIAGRLAFLGDYSVIVIPAIGGLVVGPLVYFFAKEAKGHGVPEVMEAVALKAGRIRPRVAVVKSLASSVCIGSGGSVGREGPIVQIGSALGSTFGKLFKLSDEETRNLVACGAAGGIAATFNAPIAGALFALEVILRDFSTGRFGAVVISSVFASVIGRAFFGDVAAFHVPAYSLVSPWELLFYGLLGIIAGFVSFVFIKSVYWAEDRFDSWPFPEYLKAAVGGLGVGVIGYFYPQIFGVGYGTIEKVLLNQTTLILMLILIPAKILATSFTLGSGGSGGIFSPSLFLGAVIGGSFGRLASHLFPTITGTPGAYALVAMGAVFAGAARAPICAVVFLFELTGDYRIILPLMLSTVIGTLFSERLSKESIYTLKLVRRGVRIYGTMAVDLLEGMKVADVTHPLSQAIPAYENIKYVLQSISESPDVLYPVLDSDGKYVGAIYLEDLPAAMARTEELSNLLIAGDLATVPPTVKPSDSLKKALDKLVQSGLDALPVVSEEDPTKVIGSLRRRDVVHAYNKELAKTRA